MIKKAITAGLAVSLLVSLSASCLNARSMTRDDALRKIITEVVGTNVDQVRLYITPEPVEEGAEFVSWKRVEMSAPGSGWFAFIDDHPTANFEHSVRYLFVDSETGRITTKVSSVPPREMGTYYEYPTEIGRKLDAAKQVTPRPYDGPTYPVSGKRGGGYYAVILSGGADAGNNHIRYWNDCSNIYITLKEVYEYPDENIFVLISDGTNPAPDRSNGTNSPPDLDGDGDDDIMGPCVLSEIQSLFDMLGDLLSPGDQLFVFTTDHGGSNGGWNSYLNLWNWEVLNDNVFEGMVNALPECDMIFTMEQCYSGGFEDNLSWNNEGRVFSSAAAYNEVSWAMPPDYVYDTYVFYWTAAVKGEDAYGNPVNADYNSDGVITMDEAFLFAESEDFSDETPQYNSNPLDLGEQLSLWGTRSFINGFVTDLLYGNPLIASVRLSGDPKCVVTEASGYYELPCPDDTTLSVEASSYGYRTLEQNTYVPPDSSARLDFALEEALPGGLQGWVRSALDGSPLEGAEVTVLETPLEPQITDDEGFYSFVIPGGATYMVEAVMPTYIGGTQSAGVSENDTTVLSFALGQAESFEDDDGGYTGLMLWEWGAPSSYGPGGAHWGEKCWATNLDGPYGNNANSPLTSRSYDLVDATSATLNFYHYYKTELNRDGGNVKISTDQLVPWVLITPEGGYPTASMYWNQEPGFTGSSNGWELVTFDLNAHLGDTVEFKFTFGSDGYLNNHGWYIDDVFLEVTYPVSVALSPDSPTVQKGTNLGFQVDAMNTADDPITLKVWSEVLMPNGMPYSKNPMFGPYTLTVPAHATPSVHLEQYVPFIAPVGTYTYIMKIGQNNDTVYARDFFDFTVVP